LFDSRFDTNANGRFAGNWYGFITTAITDSLQVFRVKAQSCILKIYLSLNLLEFS